MHDHRAMRPATGRLMKRPDRRFLAALLGALGINAAVAIGLVTLTTGVTPLNRPIVPLVVSLLDPPAPVAPKDPPPLPPPPPIKPTPSLAPAPQARPAQTGPAETKRAPVPLASPAGAPPPPAVASLPAPTPSTPAPPVAAAPAPPAENAITLPSASASSAPGADASPPSSAQSPRQASAAGSSGASQTARRTGPRVDASWAGNTAPGYPSSARRMGEQGQVRLDVHVGADGAVIEVQLRESSGSAALDRSAMEAVRKWRFRPATVDGQPVAEWYRNWEWIFRLEG